jgi:hypothetical protein
MMAAGGIGGSSTRDQLRMPAVRGDGRLTCRSITWMTRWATSPLRSAGGGASMGGLGGGAIGGLIIGSSAAGGGLFGFTSPGCYGG